MAGLQGFGLRTYRVLVEYKLDGFDFNLEFGGIRATSVAKAKEQASTEFASFTGVPTENITHMFAVMTI